MSKLSRALWSVAAEVSTVVGPKTTTRAIHLVRVKSTDIATGAVKLSRQACLKATEANAARLDRKELFNRLNAGR